MPKRKYNDEYIKFGFTDITVNKEVRPQCVICTTVLSNDARTKTCKIGTTFEDSPPGAVRQGRL